MKISKSKNPKIGEYVKVKVTKYVDFDNLQGVYCTLEHYNNLQALLLPSEAVKNKYQRVEKLHVLGSNIICVVINVENNNIDISYKKVNFDDEQNHIKKFIQFEKLYAVCTYIFELYKEFYKIKELGEDQEDFLHEQLFWKFICNDDTYNIYNLVLENLNLLFQNSELEEDFIKFAYDNLITRIKIIPYKVSIDIKLYVYHETGIMEEDAKECE